MRKMTKNEENEKFDYIGEVAVGKRPDGTKVALVANCAFATPTYTIEDESGRNVTGHAYERLCDVRRDFYRVVCGIYRDEQ